MNDPKLDPKKIIFLYLNNPINDNFRSGFIKVLQEARKLTGRDITSGLKNTISLDENESWLGVTGYMILLDQIGKCFKPKGLQVEKGNAIQKALKYFSNLESNRIDAIYALRCAFAHDFSLANQNDDPSLRHRFLISTNKVHPLVSLPVKQWSGKYYHSQYEDVTIININLLCDLVEEIYTMLLKLVREDNLEIVLKDGVNEFTFRYGLQLKN